MSGKVNPDPIIIEEGTETRTQEHSSTTQQVNVEDEEDEQETKEPNQTDM